MREVRNRIAIASYKRIRRANKFAPSKSTMSIFVANKFAPAKSTKSTCVANKFAPPKTTKSTCVDFV